MILLKHTKLFNMFHNHALQEYLNLCNKTDKRTCIKYVLSCIINYQCVSFTFVIIIIRVALQGYSEYNKLPNCVSILVKLP